jgi:DUF2075 family protein
MANIARLKTWNLKETLTSADLNAEFDNILSGTNNGSLDSDNIDQTDTYTWSGNHTFNSLVTHGANLTVGVNDTGHDVQFFGATSGAHLLWDESADTLKMVGGAKTDMQGTLTVGVDDTGYDVKFFGATTGKYMLWDESADTLAVVGTAITLNGTALTNFDVTATHTWTADQTFNDNVKVTLGTGGDADLYYDGSHMILLPRVVGSGNVGINTTAPDGLLHVFSASAGTVTPHANADELVVEGSAATGISIIGGNNAGCSLFFGDDGATNGAYEGQITYDHSGPHMMLAVETTERMRWRNDGDVVPGADNAQDMGASGARWGDIWAASGSVNTSDETQKVEIANSDLGLSFITALTPIKYKLKESKGEVRDTEGNLVSKAEVGTRFHYGLGAQSVKGIIDAMGIDFAGYVDPSVSGDEGSLGLRYSEFIGPIIQAIKEMHSDFNSRLTTLESA